MAYLRQEDFDKAIEFYEMAIAEIESLRSQISSEHRRASFFGKHQTIYQGLIEALLKRSERSAEKRPDQARAFAVLERARARSVLDALSSVRHELDKELAPELGARQKTLSEHIAELQRRLLRAGALPNEQRQLLERLGQAEDEFELLLSKLKSGNPRYVAALYPQPLSLAHAQSALDDETALLAYSILRDGVAVFVLTRTDFHVEKLSVAPEALSSRVQNYVDLLAVSDDEGWKAISHRLENDLLSSARGHLNAEIRRLVIVPDGTLHYLPFETLRAAHNSRFLIEDFEISYVPSATVFAQLKVSQPAGERQASALVFADPSLPAKLLSANESQPKGEIARSLFEHESWQVQPLPASAHEAEAIARFAGQSSRVYTGTAASEKRLKSEPLEGYRILHFATHGLISQEMPARSSLVLSIEGDADAEDGLLQAREIYQLKLSSDLVVLSGCQTARGQILKGEGIEGLAQAFFYAGARSVVASLWRVTDEPTAEFMRTFYKTLGEGKSKAASLRTAKLQLLQADETLAPRHWAAFVLLGEANDSIATPRGEGQSQRWKWALLGIGGLCVVLTAFLIFRR
jgi:CHAT domain-containing protein